MAARGAQSPGCSSPSSIEFGTGEREKNSRRDKSEPAVRSEEEIYRSKRREIEEEINDSAVSRGSNKTAL